MTVLRSSEIKLQRVLAIVLASDTLSITTMEIADNTVITLIPGAMSAQLTDILFWSSMAFLLVIAFVAAFPVNRYLLQQGKGHALIHTIETHDGQNKRHSAVIILSQ
jgi:hypothetical protein